MAALLSSPSGPVHRALASDVNRLRNVAVRECPVDKGGLRSSHIITTRRVGDHTVWSVGTRKSYAAAVHEGSRAHVIERRGPFRNPAGRVRTLRFTGRSGAPVFRRLVHHPGYRGNPWLRRSLLIVFGR